MATRSQAEIEELIEELGRHGLGGIHPDADQLRALLEADRDGPLQFVNLLRYHDRARYPEGHELADAGLSGAEAYNRYGMVALAQVTERGGSLFQFNDVEQLVIGTGEWDQIATMVYADTDAFIEMLRDPEYTAALVHRTAGLADTVILATRPLLPS